MLQLLSFGKKTITNSLSIYVKSNTGNTLSVDLNPKWDIKDVKEYVAPLINMDPGEIKIIFAGKELSDSTKLEVSGESNAKTIHFNYSKSFDRSVISVNRAYCMQ